MDTTISNSSFDIIKTDIVNYITNQSNQENKTKITNNLKINLKNNPSHINFFITYSIESINEYKDTKLKSSILELINTVIESLSSFIVEVIKNEKDNEKEGFGLRILLKNTLVYIKNTELVNISIRLFFNLLVNHVISSIITNEELVNLIVSTFEYESFPTPTYNQDVRIHIYKILYYTLNDFSSSIVLGNLSNTFMILCLNSIENEKDPRNLLVMFDLLYLLQMSFNEEVIKSNKDQLLNIFTDYYPIEFNPPKNFPIKITQEELSDALNKALLSSKTILNDVFDMIKENILSLNIVFSKEGLKSLLFCFSSRTDHRFLKKIDYSSIWKESIDVIVSCFVNNLDEEIHLLCIMSLKNIISYDFFEENELKILVIESLYTKCFDMIYSTQPQKNSYDARDILLVLLEYSPKTEKFIKITKEMEKRTIEIFLLVLSNHLNMKTEQHILKNISFVCLFLLKKGRLSEFFKFEKMKLVLNSFSKRIFSFSYEKQEKDEVDFNEKVLFIELYVYLIINMRMLFENDDVLYINDRIDSIFDEIPLLNSDLLKKISVLKKELIRKEENLNETRKRLEKVLFFIEKNDEERLNKEFILLEEYVFLDFNSEEKGNDKETFETIVNSLLEPVILNGKCNKTSQFLYEYYVPMLNSYINKLNSTINSDLTTFSSCFQRKTLILYINFIGNYRKFTKTQLSSNDKQYQYMNKEQMLLLVNSILFFIFDYIEKEDFIKNSLENIVNLFIFSSIDSIDEYYPINNTSNSSNDTWNLSLFQRRIDLYILIQFYNSTKLESYIETALHNKLNLIKYMSIRKYISSTEKFLNDVYSLYTTQYSIDTSINDAYPDFFIVLFLKSILKRLIFLISTEKEQENHIKTEDSIDKYLVSIGESSLLTHSNSEYEKVSLLMDIVSYSNIVLNENMFNFQFTIEDYIKSIVKIINFISDYVLRCDFSNILYSLLYRISLFSIRKYLYNITNTNTSVSSTITNNPYTLTLNSTSKFFISTNAQFEYEAFISYSKIFDETMKKLKSELNSSSNRSFLRFILNNYIFLISFYPQEILLSNLNRIFLVIMTCIEMEISMELSVGLLKDVMLRLEENLQLRNEVLNGFEGKGISLNKVISVILNQIDRISGLSLCIFTKNMKNSEETKEDSRNLLIILDLLFVIYLCVTGFSSLIDINQKEDIKKVMKSLLRSKKRKVRRLVGFINRKLLLS